MLTQHLAPAEQLTLVKVIDALQQVSTVSQFFSCLDGVFQELLAHECMACGIVQISQGSVRPRHMLLHHFPAAYLAQIRQTDGSLCSPALAYWCQHREPMAINLHDPAPGWPESMLAHARAFELCNLLSHGHTDIGSQQGMGFFLRQHLVITRLALPQPGDVRGVGEAEEIGHGNPFGIAGWVLSGNFLR